MTVNRVREEGQLEGWNMALEFPPDYFNALIEPGFRSCDWLSSAGHDPGVVKTLKSMVRKRTLRTVNRGSRNGIVEYWSAGKIHTPTLQYAVPPVFFYISSRIKDWAASGEIPSGRRPSGPLWPSAGSSWSRAGRSVLFQNRPMGISSSHS
jgi:hypothetical protein